MKITPEQEQLWNRYCDALLSRGICPPLHKNGSRKKRSEVTGKEMMELATAAHRDVLQMMDEQMQTIRFNYPARRW